MRQLQTLESFQATWKPISKDADVIRLEIFKAFKWYQLYWTDHKVPWNFNINEVIHLSRKHEFEIIIEAGVQMVPIIKDSVSYPHDKNPLEVIDLKERLWKHILQNLIVNGVEETYKAIVLRHRETGGQPDNPLKPNEVKETKIEYKFID